MREKVEGNNMIEGPSPRAFELDVSKKRFFLSFFFGFLNNQIKYMSRETMGTNRISVLRIKK